VTCPINQSNYAQQCKHRKHHHGHKAPSGFGMGFKKLLTVATISGGESQEILVLRLLGNQRANASLLACLFDYPDSKFVSAAWGTSMPQVAIKDEYARRRCTLVASS